MQGDISSFELRTSTNLYESYTSFETPFEASSTTTLKSLDIQQETDISIKTGDIASNDKKKDQILIEVSDENEKTLDFCYWIDRNTDQTLSSVVWKYWRYRFYRYFRPDDGLEDFPIEEKDLKIELKQKSNDKVSGTIHKRQERISTLLNQHSCPDQVGEPRALVEEEEDGCTVLKLCVVGAESKTNITLSRLDVLKQVLDRYNYETHIGLITFAAKPMVTIRISHALQGLQQSIANMKAEDDTALWDALLLAKDQLTVYGEKYPHARKRIICISDGIDTKPSKTTAEETYLRLQEVNIVVDSVALGEDDGSEIRALSYLLGGYCFNPISLTGALAMCEQEPFLSLSERPITELSKRHRSGLLEGLETLSSLGNRVAFTTFTRRMAHPRLKDPVLRLEAFANGHNASSIADQSGNRAPGLRILCLLNEIRAMANDAADRYPMYDVYISEADLGFWKVVMRGPEGTAYAAGTFLLHLDAGEGYPTVPPTARFVTKVRHPNVNWTHGRVCHSIMGRDWTPDTSMAGVLGAIYALFFQVEPKDFFDTRMTVSMLRDKARFEQRIHEFVDKYATKSREEWRSELLGSS
ncbi:hypothetical protein PGQ11_001839 [Apiospora arundinis]|uniref:UBC core domain-containing protein n=1 Tax=Apiospora arundinis TaxID=335852 RepID=A0ABR2JHB9_9PEZI